MTVERWIGQEFNTTHERRAFDQFIADMEANFGQSKQLYLVLANYSLEGREIDLTVLKRDAIIVIELKECTDPIEASENGDWLTIPDKKIIGTGNQNPYQQAKNYRLIWANFLKRNASKLLSPTKVSSMDFMHTSAFVAISPSLHPNTKNNIPARLPWFRLVGLDKLSQAIGQQTSRSLNFSDQDLRSLVANVLHLKKFDPNDSSGVEATNTLWIEYCRNLLTTHQYWTVMPPVLYLSPKQMDIAPARVILDKEQSKEFKLQSIPKIEHALKDFEPLVIKSMLRGILESSSSETKDLLFLVDEFDRPVMLLGHPGLGKSVAMERLALKYAERYLQDKTSYVPVLIRLQDYDSQKRNLRNWIRIKLQSQGQALSEVDTAKILQAEKLLLLFDGLDETPKSSDIVSELEMLIQEYPHHRYVISSRLNMYRTDPSRIIGCHEVELQALTSEEAARLWRSFVDKPDFDVLPEKAQDILRVPLLLRLCIDISQPTLVKIKTEIQVMDLIARKLSKPLKIPKENREVTERCLFRLALEEGYVVDREQIFDTVVEYLDGKSIHYQQEITTTLLEHPLLVSTDDYVSFWHPVFKDYYAARGLKDVVIKESNIESVLNYLGDRRWDDTIVYLAQILDDADLAKLLEYLLDFNNPILALRCIRQRPSPPEHLIESVVRGLSAAIVAATEEIPDEITPQEMGIFLLTNGEGLTQEHLSQQNLTILLDYIDHLTQAVKDYELAPEICIEPYLQPVLLSQKFIHCLVGLYWLHHHLQAFTPFSDNFIAAISESFNPDFFATFEGKVDWVAVILFSRVFIDLLPRIEHLASHMEQQGHALSGWEEVDACGFYENCLHSSEPDSFITVLAALGLTRLEGGRALELLLSLRNHKEAQVRLVVVLGLVKTERHEDLIKMMYDPNPIVAHHAALFLLPAFIFGLLSGRQFRLMVENLVLPLTGRISSEIILGQFAEFSILTDPLNPIVNPYAFQQELNLLSCYLLKLGSSFGYQIVQSKENEDKIAALLGSIVASIWALGLVNSGKVSLPASAAPYETKEISEEIAPLKMPDASLAKFLLHETKKMREWIVRTEELLIEWINATQEGHLYYRVTDGKFKLTNDNITYIKSWTDHDLTREIAEEVLAGRYKPRLNV